MRRFGMIVAAAGLIVAAGACGSDDSSSSTTTAPPVDIVGVVVEDGQSNGHVDDPTYEAAPPSGGDHIAVWMNCGVYTEPIPDGNAVHSLEHGAVWFAYDPALSADDVAVVEALAAANPAKTLVSPYPGIDSAVVAVAWERRLEVDDPADPRLAEFAAAFIDAPHGPEPGVTCAGGIG